MPRKSKTAYNNYMKKYMPTYRKEQTKMIKEYKKMFNIPDKRRKKK